MLVISLYFGYTRATSRPRMHFLRRGAELCLFLWCITTSVCMGNTIWDDDKCTTTTLQTSLGPTTGNCTPFFCSAVALPVGSWSGGFVAYSSECPTLNPFRLPSGGLRSSCRSLQTSPGHTTGTYTRGHQHEPLFSYWYDAMHPGEAQLTFFQLPANALPTTTNQPTNYPTNPQGFCNSDVFAIPTFCNSAAPAACRRPTEPRVATNHCSQ